MKKILCFPFIIFLFCLCAENIHAQKVLTKSIEYDVPIYSSYANQSGDDTEWWKNNLRFSVRTYLIKTLFEKAKDGSIQIFDDKGFSINVAEKSTVQFKAYDTLTFERTSPPYEEFDSIVTYDITAEDIRFLRFRETWTYDLQTFYITKTIEEYAPVQALTHKYENAVEGEDSLKYLPLFWVKCSPQNNDKKNFTVLTELIANNCKTETRFPNEPEFYNLIKISRDSFSRKAYIAEFCDSAQFGNMDIYQPLDVSNYLLYKTDSLRPLNKREKELLFSSHSEPMPDPEGPPWDFYDTVIYKPFDPTIISIIRFSEKWLIDPNSMEIKKEVLGMTPVQIVYDKETVGMKPLFTVFYRKPKREFTE